MLPHKVIISGGQSGKTKILPGLERRASRGASLRARLPLPAAAQAAAARL